MNAQTNDPSTPRCPIYTCGKPMKMTSQAGHDRKGGLIHWQCLHCGHEGMTAPLGVQLMFCGGQEYVFTYNNSLVTLRILLSSPAVGLFKSHDLGSDALATQVAEWAILMGQSTGAVRLFFRGSSLLKLLPLLLSENRSRNASLDFHSIVPAYLVRWR